jgi:CheY-like chemotaxis protein
MPDMDGFELIRSLRQSHSNLPILAMPGAPSDLLTGGMAPGVVGALQKPFTPDDLQAMVDKILGS